MSNDDEDEAETWFHKIDKPDQATRAALLQVEGRRMFNHGDFTGCGPKFIASAKIHMELARSGDASAYNNAAVDDQLAFSCNGDPQLMRDAAAAIEAAYRREPDDPIVAGNLYDAQNAAGSLRIVAKWVDAKALRLDSDDAGHVIDGLLDSRERASVLAELASDSSMRRAREVLTQFEILAPNSPTPYVARVYDASRIRDADALAGVLERARGAKAIETSEILAAQTRWLSGAADDKRFAVLDGKRVRFEAALARKDLDGKTRAVASSLLAGVLVRYAVFRGDPALLLRAQEAAVQAQQLWPALDTHELLTRILLDQAGLAADAKAWTAARRLRDPVGALDQLAADHKPLATAIRGAAQWSQIVAHAKADTRRPDVDSLRLARMIGDPELEARARAVLDDKILHLELEIAGVLDPSNAVQKAELAYLDRR